MDPESEKSFNISLEQWISKQGLLFQFTHNTSGGSIFPKICRLLFRFLLIGLIGLVILWFYLNNRPKTGEFKNDVQQQIAKGLNANKVEIKSIIRDKGGILSGEMLFSSISLSESENSFFKDWRVREQDISGVGRRSLIKLNKTATFNGVSISPFGIGDNYFNGWSGKEIKIQEMELKLKIGANTDEKAMAAYLSLFKQYETLNISNIQISKGDLLWGQSESSSGSIKGAQFNIVRGEDLWEINLTGGTFSHNWLKNAYINKMKVICKRSGEVIIESASFNLGKGELMLNASIQIESHPEIKGEYRFEGVNITDLIGQSYEKWFDGTIAGEGVLSGKLDSEKGIKIITTVNLKGSARNNTQENTESPNKKADSVLIIRGDEFELLKIMQMKDPLNSYSMLRVHKGKLIVENQGHNNKFTINNLRCGLNDLILMKGQFSYSPSTQSKMKGSNSPKQKENESDTERNTFFGDEKSKEVERSFSGELQIGFIPDVFENNPKILDIYPVDGATLRVWLGIKLVGKIDELTEDIANKLFDIMEKSKNN